MSRFFKGIGKGVLYVIGFPFLIVGLAIACVVSVFIFLFQLIKLIFLFFTGRNLFSDLDEDIKAKEILQKMNQPVAQETTKPVSALDLYPSNSPMYGSQYISPLENIDTKANSTDDIPSHDDGGDYNA